MRIPLSRVGGRDILFVMAVEAEHGAHLRARFDPLFTGVGPVEAGVATGAALARLAASGRMPDLVVSLGSAGSARLQHGAVYQATEVAWRDVDASALGFARGETPFSGLPPVLPLPLRVTGIPGASLSTGADVVSGARYGQIAQDMG